MKRNHVFKVMIVLLLAVGVSALSGCKGNETKQDEATADTLQTDTAAPTIKAYSTQVEVGEHPDYMKDVEATLDGREVMVSVDTSAVDLTKPGDYTVTYSAVGENGVVASKKVNLRVTDSNKKVVYLTFDDGPCPNTGRILNILKENGVHATFFVTAQDPNSFKYIAQAAEEGHAIAAHTYSHNFNIYTSFETYFADLEKIEAVIEKYTGKRTNIIRFPGGSSNRVFRHYSSDPNFMVNLAKEVQNRGYQYVDWNADSQDASTASPSAELVRNSACRLYGSDLCLLMHDIKRGTAEALPDIIKFFKDNGYTFGTLTSTNYVCHHGIKARGTKKVDPVSAVSKPKADSAAVPVVENPVEKVEEKPAEEVREGGLTHPSNTHPVESESTPKVESTTTSSSEE